jgi:hypothetical protein
MPAVSTFRPLLIACCAALCACHCGDQESTRVHGLVVRAGDRRIEVDWDPVPGCNHYEVYWDYQPEISRWSPAFADTLSSPPFVHRGLVNGQRYCYRVSSYYKGRPTEPSDTVCGVPGTQVAPQVLALDPTHLRGDGPFELKVIGTGFRSDALVLVDGAEVPTRFESSELLLATLGPHARGSALISVRQGLEVYQGGQVVYGNDPPRIAAPGPTSIEENETLLLKIDASDPDGDPLRLFAEGLPPGARWDEADRTLSFTPTFIQGGQSWTVRLIADDGFERAEGSFELRALDTISPPTPSIERTDPFGSATLVTLSQLTDSFLDSPGYSGRRFGAKLVVPSGTSASHRVPVRVQLHGFQGYPSPEVTNEEFRLYPTDTMGTYWYGYSDRLPGGHPEDGTVNDYTARRVLALVEWVLRKYPGADPERVYLYGGSMGGSGALSLALLYPRHFALAEAFAAQTVARAHRPSRITQLETLWGPPESGSSHTSVWDTLDMTRALVSDPAARDQYLIYKHGKDDTVIHFGAAVLPSPLTGTSFLDALQERRVGHFAIWDESGHETSDPRLGSHWWDAGWSPAGDPVTFLRRDLAFPAFSRCSGDRDAGDGRGNGLRAWNEDSGYAGNPSVAGDTGWDGDLAGAHNRFLRWDATTIVDEIDRFEIGLVLLSGSGSAAPAAGYPTIGDRLDVASPVRADVTIRRAQRFQLRPGERVRWSYGGSSDLVDADADGLVTVPQLEIGTAPATLRLERAR